MRRIAAAVLALALCATVAGWVLASGPEPASAGVPTPTPTQSPEYPGFKISIDCDVNAPGVQALCDVPLDAPVVEVDLVFENDEEDIDLASFNFIVEHADPSRLIARPSAPCPAPFQSCNPDFDEAVTGLGWSCGSPPPDEDVGASGGDRSFLGCYNNLDPHPVPFGATVRLARVRYDIAAGASLGAVPFTLDNVSAGSSRGSEVVDCREGLFVFAGACVPATINLVAAQGGSSTHTPTVTPTATPTRPPAATPQTASDLTATPTADVYEAIDCALSVPGIQSACTYFTSDATVDVGVVLVNNGAASIKPVAFDFIVRDHDTSRLLPPVIGGLNDANPDLNEGAVSGSFTCSPLIVVTPPTAIARLGCSNFPDNGGFLGVGSQMLLAIIRFDVPTSSLPGPVLLNQIQAEVVGSPGVTLLDCRQSTSETDACLNATITLIDPPPTVHKIPEGEGTNVDLAVPKANLWICELGPCAGPGEGSLRVVERATDVQDGLGAYEFTVEYDNFVISSVNPCDLVFGPGGAGSARGPVDEEDESAINPDCSPDPGPGGGTCSYSHILENVVHFGCATAGQVPGPTGDMDLASLLLIPHEDLSNDLFPGNENGVLTVLKDNGCELVDILGHPVTGSVNGGLVPVCGDLAVTVRILEGDLDLNCLVDVTDAQLIAGRYGAFFGSLLYTKWYDLEPALHDLDIDIKDIQKVFGRAGSSCQAPIPEQPPLDPPVPFG